MCSSGRKLKDFVSWKGVEDFQDSWFLVFALCGVNEVLHHRNFLVIVVNTISLSKKQLSIFTVPL